MKTYDYVVVGSGCAGLTAALECASKGKKTLLIEKHNIPGGCASSFVRGRFEFEPSLHELCSLGSEEEPGNVRLMMNKFGVNVNWKKVDDCFRVITKYTDGTPMDVTMPTGREAFIDKMEEYVPGSKKSMQDLFELFAECQAAINAFTSGSSETSSLVKQFPNALKVGSYPCSKVFKALKLPQKAIDILSTYWSYLGVDMDNLSFIHYSMMVDNYIGYAAYIPTHTSHEISVAMVERFRELGGEVLFNCKAEKFIFEGSKCVGVETNLGTFGCKCVLANINPHIIYANMMPSQYVPEREKKLCAARDGLYSARMCTAYFGLNKTAEELGIKDYSIFLSGTSDSAKEYESLKSIDTNDYTIFLCYNIANPEASPEGTCMCSFTTFFSGKDCKDWNNVSDEDYVKLKTKVAKKFLKALKSKAGIDLAPYVEEVSLASPLTFARYIGVPEGCVYGYEASGWDDIISRSMSVEKDYVIDGLIPIGTSGPRGDGYSSAYACGVMMADIAMKKYENGGNN